MTRSLTIALTLVLAGVVGSPAQQQPSQAPIDSKACAPQDRLRANPDAGTAQKETTGENLSDKLARTDGVICPPAVDPDIRLPTPQTGNMPVIPPPGAPGGDPSVRPK